MDILDYKEPITKIYFIRHGETRANKLKLLFGQLNLDLTRKGTKQAKRAAVILQKVKAGFVKVGFKPTSTASTFDYLISSSLKRAKHTARIIAKKLGIKKIIIDKNLIEKSEGLWEGKSFWEVREKDPTNYYKWLKNPFKNRPPKGESVEDLNKRVKKFYKQVLKNYLGKNIIVVAHSGLIRLFLLNLLGADISKFWYLKIECGTVTEVHVSKKHATIWAINIQ